IPPTRLPETSNQLPRVGADHHFGIMHCAPRGATWTHRARAAMFSPCGLPISTDGITRAQQTPMTEPTVSAGSPATHVLAAPPTAVRSGWQPWHMVVFLCCAAVF